MESSAIYVRMPRGLPRRGFTSKWQPLLQNFYLKMVRDQCSTLYFYPNRSDFHSISNDSCECQSKIPPFEN
jgi:hypothetical protein